MSFTLEHIKEAHSKVKSGADFPNYIQDLVKLGVKKYETYVSDGHSVYFSKDNVTLSSVAKYPGLEIAKTSHKDQFKHDLKHHQQGGTDYMTFCKDCARAGVEKWVVDISKMTCTYYDKTGNELLQEIIPGQ